MRECTTCKICYTDDVVVCVNDDSPTFHTISGEPVLEGKYHLECRLGQGGMGVVYKARHAYLKTLHAIKIILPDLVGNDPQLVTRFRQEALAAAAIRHQNVVSVTDYGVAIGVMPFLVMEYVEGESLHDLLAREKRLSPEEALELMCAIGAGVGAAHQGGIVHRDLKPLNVMILKDKNSIAEAVKILDFGLAKIKSGEVLGSFIQAQTTGLMGSPYYMAPEQWNDEEPDARADVYSLGVMLYQMIAGDVPFKGNSIPAIMKKHLTNDPPPFSDFNVQVDSLIELAVFHTLEKDPDKRTPTVEQMIAELRQALEASESTIPDFSAAKPLPVSNLRILTKPPQSRVFVDNIGVGESRDDGWLLLEGVQSGNHHLRVRHDGFEDWEKNLTCDGTPVEVVAELKKDMGAIPRPAEIVPVTDAMQPAHPSYSERVTRNEPPVQITEQNVAKPVAKEAPVQITSQIAPAAKKPFLSPVILAIIGICGLFLLTAIGIAAAFMLGLIGSRGGGGANGINSAPQTDSPVREIKAEMVKIPGGTFKMGRNDGEILEKPENDVAVKDFWMDKTEVTNAEYADFVRDTDHKPVPSHWENNKPVAGQETMPVRYVNLNDINAFIAWRSKRDNMNYRLPTEAEWEYAARNGVDASLYPWGNNWEDERAVVNRNFVFEAVGSKPNGANKWGVMDLIGNVWEWTSTPATAYKGADSGLAQQIDSKYKKDNLVVRGTFSINKENSTATATIRSFSAAEKRDKVIGFRLVRSE